MTSPDSKPGSPASPWSRSPAEWVTFGFACMILLTLVGLIVVDWSLSQNRPPILQVFPSGSIRVVGNQYYVPFTVTNQGGAIAESIQVVAELMVDDELVENGDQTIDSLSGGEKRQGSFVFSVDPNQGQLLLRVASYRLPQPLAPTALPEWLQPANEFSLQLQTEPDQ